MTEETSEPIIPPLPADFRIVPRKGVPAVLAIGVLLAAAIVSGNVWLLDLLHVAGAAVWMVLDVFLGFVLGPILNRLAFETRVRIAARLMPRMLLIMPTAVTVTLAAGWQLGVQQGTVEAGSPAHGLIVASFFVAAFLEVTALGVLQPANVAVLAELKKRRPDPVVVARLMRRFLYAAAVLGVGQIAILVIMTRVVATA